MKKTVLVLFLITVVLAASAEVLKAPGKNFNFQIVPMHFLGQSPKVYMRMYISIPVVELGIEKEAKTKKGESVFFVNVEYSVQVRTASETVNKESWKQKTIFSRYNVRTHIMNFYDCFVPEASPYEIEVTVTDLNSKKEETLVCTIQSPVFNDFSVSSFFWATQIRKAEPDDERNYVFNSLYFKPIVERSLFSPNFPMFYADIYNLTDDGNGMYPYSVEYDIMEGGKSIYRFHSEKTVDMPSVVHISEPPIFDIFNLLPKGTYEIKVTIKDMVSEKEISVNEAFEKID